MKFQDYFVLCRNPEVKAVVQQLSTAGIPVSRDKAKEQLPGRKPATKNSVKILVAITLLISQFHFSIR